MTEVERVKPRAMAVEEAIALALESRWSDAVSVNRRFLEQHGPDEDAFNRLGKALSELGEVEEALAAYRQTVELNPLNLIAPKMIRKLEALLSAATRVEGSNAAIDVDLFTEEPGKSGLSSFAVPAAVAAGAVTPGDVVELRIAGSTLHAATARGVDLGDLDTKLARRLIPLIEGGNRYSAAVARVEDSQVAVMIRETFQAPENARKTSFPIARSGRREDFRPYAKESLLNARDDADELAEDEDGSLGEGDAEELDGIQAVEAEVPETGLGDAFDEEEADDDARPEDSY